MNTKRVAPLILCLLFSSCSSVSRRRPANSFTEKTPLAKAMTQKIVGQLNSGSCIAGVHRLVRDSIMVELSSGMEQRIPFEISERLSNEIAKRNEDVARRAMDEYISSLESHGVPAAATSVRLSVSSSGGGVLYEDGYLDISALRLADFNVFPYTQAFLLKGKQGGVAQMPWKIHGSPINSLILEHPTASLAPHARTFIDQTLREADLSDATFFKTHNMALQLQGKNGKLRTYWIISQPHTNPLGRKLYEDYLDFTMEIYRDRLGASEAVAADLKQASMDIMDRSITIMVTNKRLGTFMGEGGELFNHFSITSDAPNLDDIIGGVSLVMSRNSSEKLPSELFREGVKVQRVDGEIVVEATRRASKKGNKDISMEVIFQLMAMLKGMKKAKKLIIEFDEFGYNSFKKYGAELIAEPVKSFRGTEYTVMFDIDEAYELMVKQHIHHARDLQKYFLDSPQ